MCRGYMKSSATQLGLKNYEKINVTSRFCYFKAKSEIKTDIGTEISQSLSRKKKYIPSKFFYNKKGSLLFEQICLLPEYYLTQTELEILDMMLVELSEFLIGNYVLV